MRGRRIWSSLAALSAVMLVWGGWHWRQLQANEQHRLRGAALFHGELPLVARMSGHERALPAVAVRCSNCHEALSKAPLSTAQASSAGALRPYAGVIQGGILTAPRPRRGGPPSMYDESRLCALLRTGVDPAYVVISNTMPRYEFRSSDCADLWAYLSDEFN